jgi:hypothetical protein
MKLPEFFGALNENICKSISAVGELAPHPFQIQFNPIGEQFYFPNAMITEEKKTLL